MRKSTVNYYYIFENAIAAISFRFGVGEEVPISGKFVRVMNRKANGWLPLSELHTSGGSHQVCFEG